MQADFKCHSQMSLLRSRIGQQAETTDPGSELECHPINDELAEDGEYTLRFLAS